MPVGNPALHRHNQAHHQMAEAINRATGQGAGYGLTMDLAAVLADVVTTDTSVNIATANNTTYSAIANTAALFVINRPVTILFVASIFGKCQAGAGGVFAYGKVHLNGTPYGFTQGGVTAIFDSSCVGYVPNTVVFRLLLQPASYSSDVRIATDNTSTHWLQYATRLTIYQLA